MINNESSEHHEEFQERFKETNNFSILKHHISIYCSLFKVTTYESTEKRMFVFKINQNNSITGFTFEGLPEKANLENHYKENFIMGETKIWQIQTIVPKTFQFIEYDDPPIDYSSLFIKYGWDRHIKYGDGGSCLLKYPIYRIEVLPLGENKLERLTQLLENLGNKRKDWHQNSPVLDIIDPDLNPNYFHSLPPSQLPQRSSYAWFPVDILIKPDLTFQVLGEIHNLPKKENEELYELLFKVFELMLPGFKLLNIFNADLEQVIQVVIKAQKYVIKPKMTYSGKWYVEGKTENIVAGGVFYCKIYPEYGNDFLAFHPKITPDQSYASRNKVITQVEVPVNEQSAIVFKNILPHKFGRIENFDTEDIERLFINFFVVDPSKRLETNQLRIDAKNILTSVSKLSEVLIDEILSFVYSFDCLKIAKEKRETIRETIKTQKSGWGYIHYGNCGEVEFIEEENLKNYNHIRSLSSEMT